MSSTELSITGIFKQVRNDIDTISMLNCIKDFLVKKIDTDLDEDSSDNKDNSLNPDVVAKYIADIDTNINKLILSIETITDSAYSEIEGMF